ncbi:unnamed protein product [Parnassius apollo]|uniref:(apollo) hypothetical protein n=1 Tax=Parnassius apollo TaxID=110799 RepID=A0A8S3XXK1_PARAO|nr:unnamed protein product [Parnassius apollo]
MFEFEGVAPPCAPLGEQNAREASAQQCERDGVTMLRSPHHPTAARSNIVKDNENMTQTHRAIAHIRKLQANVAPSVPLHNKFSLLDGMENDTPAAEQCSVATNLNNISTEDNTASDAMNKGKRPRPSSSNEDNRVVQKRKELRRHTSRS